MIENRRYWLTEDRYHNTPSTVYVSLRLLTHVERHRIVHHDVGIQFQRRHHLSRRRRVVAEETERVQHHRLETDALGRERTDVLLVHHASLPILGIARFSRHQTWGKHDLLARRWVEEPDSFMRMRIPVSKHANEQQTILHVEERHFSGDEQFRRRKQVEELVGPREEAPLEMIVLDEERQATTGGLLRRFD